MSMGEALIFGMIALLCKHIFDTNKDIESHGEYPFRNDMQRAKKGMMKSRRIKRCRKSVL